MNQVKFKKCEKKKAVFFDRDGVLNYDTGYVHKIQSFKWIRGAKEAIKLLNDLNYLVIVITNQSGVSRGYYTENHINTLHIWMNEQLKEKQAMINDFYYCTELPDNVEKKKSRRKPSPAMINEAINKYSISKKNSFLIGDKKTDLIAAKNAQIKGFLFEGGDLFDKIQKILKEF
jgi:D-glycero-D-manno-heptose 1,7-bisphosphate phosphatase